MGIQGLLPQLKSIMSPIHIKDLKGQTVAVDTYSWLHKGALSCSRELCKGLPSTRVNLMRHYGVKPLLVFDGGLLPMKADQEAKRLRSRKENLERANEHVSAGNSSAAYECYQKAVDISPSIAYDLIQVLKRENVDYIVAPYEADSQMAFLSVNNIVDAVVTEDSDLIPFGCPRIIFKMDKFGQGVEFRSSMLSRNKDLNFFGFTQQMVLETCILSGCDYLQSLPGMGLKRAHTLIQNFKTFDKVIRHLRYNTAAVPPLYEESFQKAIWTFLHQRVYDPITEDIAHLTEISDDVVVDFITWLPKDVVKSIALGDLDPITKLPFQEQMDGRIDAVNNNYTARSFEPMKDKKKICLPVQKNILTNYFCLASIEAKRKFKAPQAKHSKHLAVTHETSPNKDVLASEDVAPTKIDDCRIKSITLVEEKFPHESLSFPERSSSLLKSNNELYTPVLASHKDHGCEILVDDRAMQGIIVRSTDPHKLMPSEDVRNIDAHNDDDHTDSSNASEENISSDINNDKASSFPVRRNRPKIDTKKRKIGEENQHCFVSHLKKKNASQDVPGKSIFEGENLVCDISHLEKYSGIAEESMKRFVSVISSFSYTSNGSRASGLRAPLKKLKNNSLNS
ncbi:Flap endonuclease 1 [Zostera marina]|uniref:Exonuclease 1 n=1 Tax=Zostera marina TaxID=29655 RepID=A0A0K9PF59_ZOSMR|nr:Flap endonuclease 1 [Zostera marina]